MKILMVCLGNICRSPLAEGIAGQLAVERGLDWVFDSASTSGWHDGNPPDVRSIRVAAQHGLDISRQQSRKLVPQDYHDFDLIIAMDSENMQNMTKIAPPDGRAKLRMMLDFVDPGMNAQVPDPYLGGDDGFLHVYNLLLDACSAMLDELQGETQAT